MRPAVSIWGTPQIDLLARIMQILDTPISELVTLPAHERFPGRLARNQGVPDLAQFSVQCGCRFW